MLAGLSPVRHEGEWVFVAVPPGVALPAETLATFREREGTTAIVPRHAADEAALPYDYVAAWIELEVNSDLAAVGLTAAMSTALANAGISCNVVAALHHDHLFVPVAAADAALAALRGLTRG